MGISPSCVSSVPDNVKMTLERILNYQKRNLHRLRMVHISSIRNEIERLSREVVGDIEFLTLNSLGFIDMK